MKSLNRRRFLGAAIGTGAAAATAGSWAPTRDGAGRSGRCGRNVPNNRIGIQLYTMREKMGNGDRAAVRRVLNRLGAMGYTEVELAGYCGHTPQLFRRWLDDAGLRAPAGHDGVSLDPENTTLGGGVPADAGERQHHGPEVHGPGLVPAGPTTTPRSGSSSPSG